MAEVKKEKKEKLMAVAAGLRNDGKGRRSKRLPEVSLTKAAKKAGVSVGYLSRIVSGKQTPGLEVAGRVGKVLGMTLEEVAGLRKQGRERGRS